MSEVRLPVYVLAGGRSRRFGKDKARERLRGIPLIVAVARALEPVASELRVVAARAGEYDNLGLATLADVTPGCGPMGGIAAALADAADGWIFVCACDLVGVRAEWVEQLAARRSDAVDCVLFADARPQPLFALYHTRMGERMARALRAGHLSLRQLIDEIPHAALPAPPGWSELVNANTRDDLRNFCAERDA